MENTVADYPSLLSEVRLSFKINSTHQSRVKTLKGNEG